MYAQIGDLFVKIPINMLPDTKAGNLFTRNCSSALG